MLLRSQHFEEVKSTRDAIPDCKWAAYLGQNAKFQRPTGIIAAWIAQEALSPQTYRGLKIWRPGTGGVLQHPFGGSRSLGLLLRVRAQIAPLLPGLPWIDFHGTSNRELVEKPCGTDEDKPKYARESCYRLRCLLTRMELVL